MKFDGKPIISTLDRATWTDHTDGDLKREWRQVWTPRRIGLDNMPQEVSLDILGCQKSPKGMPGRCMWSFHRRRARLMRQNVRVPETGFVYHILPGANFAYNMKRGCVGLGFYLSSISNLILRETLFGNESTILYSDIVIENKWVLPHHCVTLLLCPDYWECFVNLLFPEKYPFLYSLSSFWVSAMWQ